MGIERMAFWFLISIAIAAVVVIAYSALPNDPLD